MWWEEGRDMGRLRGMGSLEEGWGCERRKGNMVLMTGMRGGERECVDVGRVSDMGPGRGSAMAAWEK